MAFCEKPLLSGRVVRYPPTLQPRAGEDGLHFFPLRLPIVWHMYACQWTGAQESAERQHLESWPTLRSRHAARTSYLQASLLKLPGSGSPQEARSAGGNNRNSRTSVHINCHGALLDILWGHYWHAEDRLREIRLEQVAVSAGAQVRGTWF